MVPGLVATQHSGDGKANQYFLRGFKFERRDNRNCYGGVSKYVQAWTIGDVAQELSVGIETRFDDIGR